MRNFDVERIFYKSPDLFDARIRKFHNLACFGIYKMIMLFKLVRSFELGTIIAELVLGHQTAIEQQFDRIVQSSTANPVLVILHANVKGLDIEMAIGIIDLFKYSKSFRRLPVPPSAQGNP